MTTEALARAMFTDLIDYAGLFPPAQRALPTAYDEYRRSLQAPHAWMLGRFIVPFSRFSELVGVHGSSTSIAASVILDADRESRLWLNEISEQLATLAEGARGAATVVPVALEIPVPRLLAARENYGAVLSQIGALLDRFGLRELPCYVEFPRDDRWEHEMPAAVESLARGRLRSKIRCGGLAAAAFPSASEIAAHLRACAEYGVAWKATAGLHHPVAHREVGTGFEMHGFVNLLVASCLAIQSAPFEEIEAVLAERSSAAFAFDGDGLSWRGRRCETTAIERSRRNGLLSYGSCSVSEPLDDLVALGWLR
ncbi:MAG: hypothetical protein HKL92_09200 [Candidatus Eremiobacteraeota bacterium]|nr:hypothetical protein [Candidatus Eremiobacteraeota bacterium]NNM93506.1 hypothetical protein [Candidatus Eremiobacteraeota bacterium]